MRTTYGQRDGEGPTRGRKAETLISPSTGLRKRVFFGQRWLVMSQRDENDEPLLTAWHTEDKAREHCDGIRNCEVHYVERAEVAALSKAEGR